MMLARGFFVLSILAVISSASAGFLVPQAQGQGPDTAQPPAQERYFGPSQFA